MDTLQTVGLLILGLIVIATLGLVLIMIVAYLQWQFTRLEKGNTAFIVKGGDLKSMLPNVDGYRVSKEKDLEGRRWLVKVNVNKTPEEQRKEMREAFNRQLQFGTKWLQWILWNRLGIRFVSWFYPQIKVHKIHISMNRLMEARGVGGGEDKSENLQSRIESDEGDVDSLRFLVPRPSVVKGVELAGDNAKLDILVLAVFQTVIPALPVFYYKGKFMSLLDAEISAGIIDFCATYKARAGKNLTPLTYELWLKLRKGKGSPIQNHLQKLNASQEFYDELAKAPGKTELVDHLKVLLGGGPISSTKTTSGFSGFIPKLGFALKSVEVIDWVAAEETKELSSAMRSKQTKFHEAEGIREEAKGAGDAFRFRGTGEAERYKQLLGALIQQGVTADLAAQVLKRQVEMEKLSGSGVGTYVRGQAGIMVPAVASPSPHASRSASGS